MDRYLGLALAGLMLLFSGGILFTGLGTHPFQDYDEAAYAQIAHEYVLAGGPVTPTFFGRPFLEKPPLLFWLMGASMRVVHDPETAARFPSAAAALLCVALAMAIVYEATRSLAGSVLAGVMLTTTAAFVQFSREVRFESLLSSMLLLCAYATLRARNDSRWLLAVGVAFGLAILSKWVLAVFALVFFIVFAVATGRARPSWVRTPYAWGGAGLALLIALPWHLAETLRFGGQFWQVYLGQQVLSRVSSDLFTLQPTSLDYGRYLSVFAAPWAQLFLVACVLLPACWSRLTSTERATTSAVLATLGSMLLVYFGARTKAFSYLATLYPFMAIFLGIAVSGLRRLETSGMKLVLTLVLGASVLGGTYLSWYDGHEHDRYFEVANTRAEDEQAIGKKLRTLAPSHFYSQTDTLNSIRYYSGIGDAELAQTPLMLAPGSLLVSTSAAVEGYEPLVQGSQLSLLRRE